jgi:hypothetical protein
LQPPLAAVRLRSAAHLVTTTTTPPSVSSNKRCPGRILRDPRAWSLTSARDLANMTRVAIFLREHGSELWTPIHRPDQR